MEVRPKLLAQALADHPDEFDLVAHAMRNPFKANRQPAPPKSKLDRLVDMLLLAGGAIAIGSITLPGLFGTLLKASARTFGLLLVFLLVARAVSARIGRILGAGDKN